MSEIEIEFKNLLTREEYDKLLLYYNLEKNPVIINSNYYYDTVDEKLKKNGAALRIRHTDHYSELTLKIKEKNYNKEFNSNFKQDYVPQKLYFNTLTEDIKTYLRSINFLETEIFEQTEYIKTKRRELRVEAGLLVLDETSFSGDISDYELEFEVTDYAEGSLQFNSILDSLKIKKRPTLPKIARAKKYKK